MLTLPQILILLVLCVAGSVVVAAFLALAGRPLTERAAAGRHVADVATVRIPPPPLEVRAPAPPTDPTPVAPSPYGAPRLADVPVLVVDGPLGARGAQPAPGLTVERRHRCSYCRDGEVRMARVACPWCGLRTGVWS